MKKSLIALLVLACVAPAMAVVDFGLVGNSDGTATITINTNGDVVRGVALLVTCTNGAKLVTTTPVAVNAAFNTYIDYAFANNGYQIGDGNPFANASEAGVATVDDTTFSVSMGVLDQNGAQAGFNGSDNLITINTGAGDVCIELDTLRGGVVGDVALTANLDTPICVNVPGSSSCYDRLTAEEQGEWNEYIAAGRTADEMEPWCWQFQCHGDANNAYENIAKYRVYNVDLSLLLANWKKKAADADPAADFDHKDENLAKYKVYNGDLSILLAHWKAKDADLTPCPGYVAVP